ncbi:solute carrier family 43 member 3 [Lingula anatina]|uniref:Solute carrier family 43 member 3 n=1 Tax=Lingula anatina TaxID=7574 RepID=A0A1S3K4K8_LINAN|nr:solute carrier family 43 member 3 [Lingula anatina]|eukprot:XP_013417457.1 solute carrier family 43 member 3 [Lingula anatina]
MEWGKEPALYKAFLVAFVLIEVGLFSVCVQGWPSLVYIFRDAGFYANLCDNTTLTYSPDINVTSSGEQEHDHLAELGCAPQQEMLNLAYTLACASLVLTSVLGYIYDHCGTWCVRGICVSLCFTGTLLMAFARPGLEWLLFPGSIGQYLGGVMYLATGMQMPQLFPKIKTTLGIMVSGATDMSTSSFLFVKLAYDAGIPYQSSMLVFASIGLVISTITTILLPPRDHAANDKETKTVSEKCLSMSLYTCNCLGNQEKDSKNAKADFNNRKSADVFIINDANQNNWKTTENEDTEKPMAKVPSLPSSSADMIQNVKKPAENAGTVIEKQENGDIVNAGEIVLGEKPVTETSSTDEKLQCDVPKLYSIFKSPLFWTTQIWFSGNVLLVVMYFGSFNSIIDYLSHGDQSIVSHYTNVLGILQLTTSIPMAVAGGYVVDRQKNRAQKGAKAQPKFFLGPFFITSFSGLSLWALCAVPVLEVQYVAMLVHSLLRTFAYGVHISFLAYAFPPQHFGKIYSIQLSTQTVIGSLQYPLFYWLKSGLESSPLFFSLVNVGIACLTFCLPIYVLRMEGPKKGKENQVADIQTF